MRHLSEILLPLSMASPFDMVAFWPSVRASSKTPRANFSDIDMYSANPARPSMWPSESIKPCSSASRCALPARR